MPAMSLLNRIACLLAPVAFLAALPAFAQGPDGESVYYVTPDGNGAPPGTPVFDDIQDALNAVDGPGETVKVAAGNYTGVFTSQTINGRWGPVETTQVVMAGGDVTLAGGYAPDAWDTADPAGNPTILDAAGAGRAIYIPWNASPTISGFILTAGDATGQGGSNLFGYVEDAGGGLYCAASYGVVRECVIEYNRAGGPSGGRGQGGGVFLLYSLTDIIDCDIRFNTASTNDEGVGGGVAGIYASSEIADSRITSNTASQAAGGDGGGLGLFYQRGEVRDNVIRHNQASAGQFPGSYQSAQGGGLYMAYASCRVRGNDISFNYASGHPEPDSGGAGGGVYSYWPDDRTEYGGLPGVYFQDNTIEHNVCTRIRDGQITGRGGGVYIANSDVVGHTWLQGNTIRDNRASVYTGGDGGGVCVMEGPATLEHNTIEHNSAGLYGGLMGGGGVYLSNTTSNTVVSSNTIAHNVTATSETGFGGGVEIAGGKPVLRDNWIHHNSGANFGGSGGGVYLDAASGPRLIGNVIEDNVSHYGVGGSESTSVTLRGNTIRRNQSGGVVASGGIYTNRQAMWVIEDNTFSDHDGPGCYLTYYSPVPRHTVVDNRFLRNRGEFAYGLFLNGCEGSTISGNLFMHNENTSSMGKGGGMSLKYGGGSKIANNTFLHNSADQGGAAHVDDGETIWTNNVIADNSSVGGAGGLQCETFNGVQLYHNTFARNVGPSGIELSGGTLVNNIVVGHTVGVYDNNHVHTVHLNHTFWGDGDWANDRNWDGLADFRTSNSVMGDVNFHAPDEGDFHLMADSDARDAGTSHSVWFDFDGEARPFGPAEDIGADEVAPPFVRSVEALTSSPVGASSLLLEVVVVRFEATFSAPVTGVDATDFEAATSGPLTASVAAVRASGTTAVVTLSVSGTGEGSVRLDVVDDDTIEGGASQLPLGGAGEGNGDFRDGDWIDVLMPEAPPEPPTLGELLDALLGRIPYDPRMDLDGDGRLSVADIVVHLAG